MDKVSIIIPVRNRREELSKCLGSVFTQRGLDYEVIVIDDAGDDEVSVSVNKIFPQVRFLRQERRTGPSFLRNLGILQSGGNYLWFLDSDTELPDDSVLARIYSRMKSGDAIGSVGGEIYSGGAADEGMGRRIGFLGGNPVLKAAKGGLPRECGYLASCNCFLSKETALKIGGFDPYYLFGAEDKDLGFRIKNFGLINLVGYDYSVYHHRASRGRIDNETYHYHAANRRFILKNLGIARFFFVLLLDAVWLAFFYPLLPFKMIYKAARKIEIKKESFIAPILIIRCYIWNFRNFKMTISSRNKNFLLPREISEFLSWENKRNTL